MINPPKKGANRVLYGVLAGFGLVLIAIAIGSFGLYQRFVQDLQQNKESELLTIADLKVHELDAWRQERLNDARFYQNNLSFALLLQDYFAHPDNRLLSAQLRSWLTPTSVSHSYGAFVLDTTGKIRFSLPQHHPRPDQKDLNDARVALRSGQITFTDFHRNDLSGQIEISLVIPLRKAGGAAPLGVLFWQIDPGTKIYPLLERWPMPSDSAESLLVRREGQDVLYLNSLRFDADAALTRRVPLTRRDMPAVKVVLGQRGIVRGIDYRDVPVMAAVRAVPNSPWFLVVRMDVAELYAPIHRRVKELAAFVLVLMLTLGLSIALFWQRQREHHLQQLFKAENSLHESEERLRLALMAANQGLYDLNVQTGAAIVSPEYATMLGYVPDQFEESNALWRARLHPDDEGEAYRAYREYIDGQRPEYRAEFRQRTKNGDWKWILSQGKLIERTPDGKPLRMLGTHTDITESKTIEQALRASESRFRMAVEEAPFPIMIYAEDGEVLLVNRVLAKLSGYRSGEIGTLADWMKLAYPTHTTLTQEEIKATFDVVDPKPQERTYICRDGSQLVCIVNSVSLGCLHDGRRLAMHMAVDITERVEAQKRIRQLSQAVEQSPASVVITDNQGQIVYVNPRFSEVTGYTQAEALHQNPRILKSGELPKSFYEEMWKTLLTGREWRGELLNKKKNGALYWEAASIAPIVDEHGEITHYVAVKENITERKQMEEELRRSHEELELRVAQRTAELAQTNAELIIATETADAANQAKSEFLSRMSHELRTPLNAILGFGQLLEMENGDVSSSTGESVAHILRAGRHLLDLINEILDISRIEAGGLTLSPEPVSIAQVVSASLDLVRPLAFKNDIHLIDGLAKQCRWSFLADRQRVIQVLLNLLSNAVKYNHPGGSVTISCRVDGANLGICVSDSGPGIAPEDLDKLFMPFKRLKADKAGIEGTGLGLTLSKHLAEVMNGTLTVESVRGKGSTFCLTLPMALPMAETSHNRNSTFTKTDDVQSPPVEAATETKRHFKVLSIEDNLSNTQLIQAILAQRGDVDLLSAMQGSIGLELAQQHHPDLILLDLNLPDIHGSELLHRLRSIPETQETPVIIVSADATSAQIKRLLKGGAKAYLTKPINVKDFLRVLDVELNTRKNGTAANGQQPNEDSTH